MTGCNQCGAAATEGARFCFRCGASLDQGEDRASDPLIGRSIGSGYVLQQLVGLGGMGRVYRAEQATLGRTVAVKVIHPHLLHDEQTVSRFYQEARAASSINHPNSVGVIDFGRTEDGILYLVMEYLEGRDLADVLAEESPLSVERTVAVLLQVLDALGEAHALGVVHRDLKPENIILRRHRSGREMVKVVDFGLATVLQGDATSITQPGSVCGTPDYMAPEQARGLEVDGRTDLYALGVMLFEMLTGRLPYDGDSPTAVVMRHLTDPVPDPRKVAPEREVPEAIATIAMRAMAKDPAERFQSAEEMHAALRAALEEVVPPRASGAFVACPRCGTMNPESMRFCGTCGTRITGTMAALGEHRDEALDSRPPAAPADEPFVGFVEELDWLRTHWNQAADGAEGGRLVVLRGEPGSGRTRLLAHFAEEVCCHAGRVYWMRPHPSGARVAGSPLRHLVASMLDVPEGDLAAFLEREGRLPPSVRAGMEDLLAPRGLSGATARPRTEAVAAALQHAAERALQRGRSERLLLVVDDMDRMDALTRRVVLKLADRGVLPRSMMVVVLPSHGRVAGLDAPELFVRGWRMEEAESFVRKAGGVVQASASVPPAPRASEQDRISPLYVAQVVHLGMPLREALALEPRLADVVARRLERLGGRARELLQAVSVLGMRAQREELWALIGREAPEDLAELVRHDFVLAVDERHVELAHPFLGQLVESSIPAQVRRDLHRRALRLTTEQGAPIEVRAEHAYRTGDTMAALLLLEGVGDRALRRGLPEDAVQAYRRALELVRRAMYEQRDDADERAFVLFSLKLGEALERADDLVGADGVLREALEYVGPSDPKRGRFALLLGRVARRRERYREAGRWYGEAVLVGTRTLDREVAARAQLEMARLKRDQGDLLAAANTYRVAVEALDEAEAPVGWRVEARLEHVGTLLDVGDQEAAERIVLEAERIAEEANDVGLVARCRGTRANLLELQGRRAEAARCYEEASEEAVRAGDVDGYERWHRAAEALGTAA